MEYTRVDYSVRDFDRRRNSREAVRKKKEETKDEELHGYSIYH